jgi:NAD-dependent dihydropyrimidine dehydrogenase PreA subunit
MIDITDRTKCCGCNACVQRCPKQCIMMHEDEEGFLYPKVDQASCINCGVCDKVCPVLNQGEPKLPIKVFAAKNNNEEQRLRSSSGGIFIALAEYFIKQGGVVFGARFDKNWEVEHAYAETLEDLEPLMRSKYVQSRIGNIYKDAELFLRQGRKVLFVGTSCQIAGLKKFLRKDYDNLLAVDFICHGVPSPGIWRNYLKEIQTERSEAAGKNTVLSSIKSVPVITGINFREKQLGGYGWKKYGFVVHTKSPSKGDKNSVLLSTTFGANIYMDAFLKNYTLRPSCYSCFAKNGKSCSDMTISDFWGLSFCLPDFDDDKGVCATFVYSKKALDLFQILDIENRECTFNEGIKASSYRKPADRPVFRNRFWLKFRKGATLKECLNYAQNPNWGVRFISKLKRTVLKNK